MGFDELAGEDRVRRTTEIAGRLTDIRERIAAAASQAGRDASSVTLIAVSKGFDAETIRQTYALGVRDFGENYVQEWTAKRALLSDLPDLRWHFIGHLQSNKVKLALHNVHCIQSIDRQSIAEVIERNRVLHHQPGGQRLRVLVQLEVDPQDPHKFGVRPKDAPELCKYLAQLQEIDWAGFMGLGPAGKTSEELRPLYESFMLQARALWTQFARGPVREPVFSLGMSADFETAIACGSNVIRLGTSLFGERPRPQDTSASPAG